MGVGGVMMISGTWRRLSAERLPSAHSPCKHNLQPPRHDCPRPMVSSFGEVPEVKQNVDVQNCLRQGVFSRSWSTIQHWLPEIGEFSVHAIGLSTIEAQFEVLFFQFVCGLAPRLQRLLPRSVSSLCPCTFSFPPRSKRPTAGSGRLPVLKVARKAQH